MGYNVQAYAIGLEQLRSVIGSSDDALVAMLVGRYARELEAIEDIDASQPSAADAVCALIAGRMQDGEVNFKYGYALELVCRELGERLPNEYWSAMNSEWFDAVDDAFADLGGGTKLCSEVFWSGPPVDLPFIDDFPAIGAVLPEQVPSLAASVGEALSRAPSTREVSAPRELHDWLRAAEREGRGLITFYY